MQRPSRPIAALVTSAVLLVGALFWIQAPTRQAADHARALAAFTAAAPTQHYRILLGDSLVGTLVETRSLADGEARIASRTVTHLPGLGWSETRSRLVFDRRAPGALLRLEHDREAPLGTHYDTRLDAHALPQYRLSEAQALQRLARGDPGAGPVDVASIDPVTGQLQRSLWRHAPHSSTRQPVLVSSRADGTPLQAGFDAAGNLRYLRIGAGLALQAAEGPVQLDADAPTAAPLQLQVQQTLGPAAGVERLELAVSGPAAALFLDAAAVTPQQSITGLDSATVRVSTRRQTDAAFATATLQPLIDAVHGRLRYVPGVQPPSAAAAIRDGVGDCHEFALVFADLARRAGLEARLVAGLVWMGDDVRAFGLHAWNEVYLDERWIGVDPTWRQIGVDATHIRFPDSGGTQLDLQLALTESSLRVLDVTPGPDGPG